MKRQLYLVAYDIASTRHLRQALTALRAYALGGQKSVFECWLTLGERQELHARLLHIIDPIADRYFILRLEPRGHFRTLGLALVPANPTWFYVG